MKRLTFITALLLSIAIHAQDQRSWSGWIGLGHSYSIAGFKLQKEFSIGETYWGVSASYGRVESEWFDESGPNKSFGVGSFNIKAYPTQQFKPLYFDLGYEFVDIDVVDYGFDEFGYTNEYGLTLGVGLDGHFWQSDVLYNVGIGFGPGTATLDLGLGYAF